jgi:predicted RNase H-like HicB family nuclease
MATYIAVIHKDADSDFGASFPDLPGVATAGATLEEARANAAEALALHIEGMIEDGAELPMPSDLDAIVSSPDYEGAAAVVLVDAPSYTSRTVRVNITLPEDTLAEIDRYAKASGTTRSGLIATATRKFIRAA